MRVRRLRRAERSRRSGVAQPQARRRPVSQSLRAMMHALDSAAVGEALKRCEAPSSCFDRRTGHRRQSCAERRRHRATIHLGRRNDALASAQEARQIFERHGDQLPHARLDSNVGNIFMRQSRFRSAGPLRTPTGKLAPRRAAGRGGGAISMATCCQPERVSKAQGIHEYARR